MAVCRPDPGAAVSAINAMSLWALCNTSPSAAWNAIIAALKSKVIPVAAAQIAQTVIALKLLNCSHPKWM